jgi:hypothetical protein
MPPQLTSAQVAVLTAVLDAAQEEQRGYRASLAPGTPEHGKAVAREVIVDQLCLWVAAQLEAARLRPLGLEMRRRFHARVEVEAAGIDAELRTFLDGEGTG